MKPQRVQTLTPQVAERIAAGEVIERPASVVKELIENSLDAAATEIAIFLEEGGKTLIEVIDNGNGIHPDDLALSTQRHATSKLHSFEDLEKLTTLGFRGEALPSITAVAQLHILSRFHGEETAYELHAGAQSQPKSVTFGHFLGSPFGTRIQVHSLFSQLPARLKFLKAQSAEVSQVREWIERLAMAYPSVGFRLVSNQRALLTLKAQNETDRVHMLLSDGNDYPLISASDTTNNVGIQNCHIRLHWLQGLSSPHTRKLFQIVNHRPIRDRFLQHALLQPFKQALLPGQFPALALFIEIDPSKIDVNVHPTKTEIRFLNNQHIFQTIHSLIESMIIQKGSVPYLAPSFTTSELLPSVSALSPSSHSEWKAAETSLHYEQQALPLSSILLPPSQFVGTLFQTYLLYDLGNELALVDQHAADERVRYEKLRKKIYSSDRTLKPQILLIPEAIHFSPELCGELEKRLPWLEAIGFEVEIFGEDSLLFRATPLEWGTTQLRTRLKNLVDRLLSFPSPLTSAPLIFDETLFELLASEACHSAVRAGNALEKVEALALVTCLFQCEHPWNCPHGRPTLVRISKIKLEEWFQRRV